MSAALCLKSSGVIAKIKICAAYCTKSFLKLKSKSKKDMSVGWLEVRRTSTKLLRNRKLCHMHYLLFWDISFAWFKPKNHQIVGRPHGATILDRIMKNETANPPPFLRPPPPQIMDETAQNPKCTIFPSLFGGEEVKIFHLFRTNMEENLAEYLILIPQDCEMKFLPQATLYQGHL